MNSRIPSCFSVICGPYCQVQCVAARANAKGAGPTAMSKTRRNDSHHRPRTNLLMATFIRMAARSAVVGLPDRADSAPMSTSPTASMTAKARDSKEWRQDDSWRHALNQEVDRPDKTACADHRDQDHDSLRCRANFAGPVRVRSKQASNVRTVNHKSPIATTNTSTAQNVPKAGMSSTEL